MSSSIIGDAILYYYSFFKSSIMVFNRTPIFFITVGLLSLISSCSSCVCDAEGAPPCGDLNLMVIRKLGQIPTQGFLDSLNFQFNGQTQKFKNRLREDSSTVVFERIAKECNGSTNFKVFNSKGTLLGEATIEFGNYEHRCNLCWAAIKKTVTIKNIVHNNGGCHGSATLTTD